MHYKNLTPISAIYYGEILIINSLCMFLMVYYQVVASVTTSTVGYGDFVDGDRNDR